MLPDNKKRKSKFGRQKSLKKNYRRTEAVENIVALRSDRPIRDCPLGRGPLLVKPIAVQPLDTTKRKMKDNESVLFCHAMKWLGVPSAAERQMVSVRAEAGVTQGELLGPRTPRGQLTGISNSVGIPSSQRHSPVHTPTFAK